ncbi:hypothetical protein RUM43_007275 [Polyplax serrata]|uniref:Protein phosphatase 1 regulatory subunit 21 N-terminal domain-containing protein n=1 Tax=Polyplax serrata TaxID=468196 RepID=A0AAN8P8B6_POLSC
MSVSLLEGNSVPLDLPAKYQKLASEYAKIKAQFGVLKKAVIDEQNQTSELKEILRTKDQNLRKAEQELHSLNFRNQQLTKRVTILQDELDSAQGCSKPKLKGNLKDYNNSVIEEELQKKIAENAHLISTLEEQNEMYENEKFKLNQKIELQEHQLKEYQTHLSNTESSKLGKCETEIKHLMSRLNQKDDEIKRLYNEIKQLKSDLIGKNHAVTNADLKEKFKKLIQNLPLQELLTLLSQFYQQIEGRYNKLMNSEQFKKLEEVNQRNRLMLQDFIDKYLLYLNADVEHDILQDTEQFCDNIQQYILISQEFCRCLECSKDQDIIAVCKEIISTIENHWNQFNSTVKKYNSPNFSLAMGEELINNIFDTFRSFRSTCDYYLSIFNEKFKAHSVEKVSETEILKILSNMSLQSSSIYRKLTENSSFLGQVIEIHMYKINQKAAVTQSEQCCENWKQEIELLKVAHAKKIKDLEDQISCLSEATTPRSTNSGHVLQSPVEENEESDDPEVKTSSVFDGLEVRDETEYLKFFNARANKLIADRQYAESRVTVLKDECEALQRRLGHSLESRLVLEDSLKQTQNTVDRLQEELHTTTINYEEQLQSMSEHMANMNEKLASQQEEIEILRHELTEKNIKKGK